MFTLSFYEGSSDSPCLYVNEEEEVFYDFGIIFQGACSTWDRPHLKIFEGTKKYP